MNLFVKYSFLEFDLKNKVSFVVIVFNFSIYFTQYHERIKQMDDFGVSGFLIISQLDYTSQTNARKLYCLFSGIHDFLQMQ